MLRDVHAADEAGESDAALAILEQSRADVVDTELQRLLVERYLDLSPERAEMALREWWESEHDRFSGGGLAHLLIEQGRSDEAYDVLLESQGVDAWPEYWWLAATMHDERGNVESAISALELYTRLVPDSVDAWMLLADMQERVGQVDRALASLRRAADSAPAWIEPRVRRVRLLAQQGRWQETRDLAEILLEGEFTDVSPACTDRLHESLAQAYFVLGDFDAARRLWTLLLADRPDDRELRVKLAQLELQTRRYRRALSLAEDGAVEPVDARLLDVRFRAVLALHEYDEATRIALQVEELDDRAQALQLVSALEAMVNGEYRWALDQLSGPASPRYPDLWNAALLDCEVRLGRWSEVSATVKTLQSADESILIRSVLAGMSANKLDLAQRLLGEIEDQQSVEARALTGLLGPLRQSRRAAEARRQQQIDAADRQRWAAENRDLRRRVRDVERHNAVLADALARSEASMERLLEMVGIAGGEGLPSDWEGQLRSITERAHRDALQHELEAAEQRLRAMLGRQCWDRLSQDARLALREGEWLYEALQGGDRDYGASLLEYARGLERAYKDAIFGPVRARWDREPGPVRILQTEGLDPSLGPFVRYVLDGGHLTLGSMAAALDRMADVRRQGVAVRLLRWQLGVESWDEHCLGEWRRTAEALSSAADARNQPAHAGAVSRDQVRAFRELVLGSNGLLRALA